MKKWEESINVGCRMLDLKLVLQMEIIHKVCLVHYCHLKVNMIEVYKVG